LRPRGRNGIIPTGSHRVTLTLEIIIIILAMAIMGGIIIGLYRLNK